MTIIINDDFGLIDKKEEKHCQGQVFKANVQNFRTKRNDFGFSVRLIPMKRMSCPGCEKCGWQSEIFGEISNDWPIVGIESVEDGKFYTISVCNESRDWESGQINDWDLCLIEYISGI